MVTAQSTTTEERVLNRSPNVSRRRPRETLFSAASAGVFLILWGIIFIATPNLFGAIISFFRDFDIVKVPNTRFLILPAPAVPRTHSVVYSAVAQFSLIWGLFQIVILALRFIISSQLGKKAETASNIIQWLGTSYLITAFLSGTTTLTVWFAFWGAFVALIGLSLIIRALIIVVQRWQ
jgi:hypothetical protein